ncbi:hypothetical protein [Ralstonia solanacearum]|uniref:hypothetical protein n=1 Tax=Ralstonia solanacearum TaxID=305 RepID=UPI00078CBF0B|nr:hypothetical protein [Ralstonia solanacearum]AMP38920.1 hypothetical protein LBM2029_15850 [Ralstonia solanacearum]AXV87746.1 hypothetical protein CJO78_16290 [Ralstonia solanacearum]AXW07203.1 hypothetical protein CJO82_15945 [Ralstonia solanacearum]AXW24986.1 hypothetical protein CJO86_16195 [Ralstonia solanacearum]AXW63219.1 hypothetical protein CJO94_16145 [Ralstonia solanacearum]
MKPAWATLSRFLAGTALCLLLGACDVGFVAVIGSALTIGGTVTGLPANQSLVLLDNGRDALTVTVNGAFVFAATVPFNGSYAVTIGTQPSSASCTVSNGSGIATTDVSSVVVTCLPAGSA